VECNFSTKHYLETINTYLANGYRITPVSDFFRNNTYDKQILLRHDVDLSLDYALDMALLEKDNGIHATYYILLTSDLYHAASPKGRETIKKIKEAGHEIGLHVDSRYYLGLLEFEILSQLAEKSVTTWSSHLVNVTKSLSMPRDATKIPYKYLSDSGMNWREGCWCNHVNKFDKMQVLIHPEWHTVSPVGKRNRFEIIEDLKQEAKGTVSNSFAGFRDMVQEYIQTVKA
jgi:hypothetical protein